MSGEPAFKASVSDAAWIDVSSPIAGEMTVWPGQPRTERERISRLEEGDGANVSVLRLSLHTGTHMDAPLHFFTDGADITQAPYDVAIGPARLAHIAGNAVTRADVEAYEARTGALQAGERLLFRTAKSERDWFSAPFTEDYVAVAEDAARYLAERELRLVGVDYLSVAPFKNPADTHRALLGAGVWVVEGLDLRTLDEGVYEMFGLPLRIAGSDASPLRVLLKSR